MADPPRVSVVIPTHDRVSLVARAIDSALQQTMPDLELIVVADGSPPSLLERVRSFDDPRVRLIRHKRNRGVISARNAGIAAARGEWVAFLDDDDQWLPAKLEKVLARLEGPDGSAFAGAYSPCYVELPSGERRYRERQRPEGDLTEAFLLSQVPMPPTLYVIRRSVLEEHGGFRRGTEGMEDRDLCLRLSTAGHRFACIQEPLAVWRAGHDDQLTQNPTSLLRAYRNTDRLWGSLLIERLGRDHYHRWRRNREKRLRRVHRRHVKLIVRSGNRAAAMRYAWDMLVTFPWGVKFIAQALAFAVVGRSAYRAARRRFEALVPG
jgi:glycosyltransferase involved in cell wall biosynthesis